MRRWQIASLVIGILALSACYAEWFFAPAQFFRSYLLAFVFWVGLALGCLGVLMMQYVTGGDWGKIMRRALSAASQTLPLLAILFVPILFGLPLLYIWTDKDLVDANDVLRLKQGYLNESFFIVRQIIYFVVWTVFAFLLTSWELKRRRTENSVYDWRLEHLSAAGMFVLAITISLALIDWVMSLEPRWYSTIYAVGFIAGEMLAALAFAIPIMIYFGFQQPETLTPKRMRDMGNLLLAFVMLWAYCAFSQYLLIWAGDLRDEIPWYLPRVSGDWGWIALALIALHFFLPFFLLLSRDLKESRRWLCALALFVFGMRFVDTVWLIEPAFTPERLSFGWSDLAAAIGVGGVWLSFFLWLFERRMALVNGDERREQY